MVLIFCAIVSPRMEAKMKQLLGDENGSHASDAIYTYGDTGSQEEFDAAINKMGVEIEAG